MATKARHLMKLMRWHKPTGTILALTPSLWSISLVAPASHLLPDLKTTAIFTAGAIAARGMGCTINDILDRKIDSQVERTKNRPIASGAISVKEGLAFLAVQSSVGLCILCLNNPEVIKLGLFSGLLISTYPLFKRFTNWPQAMLAVTMNWGVLMGYAAVNGSIGLNDLPVVAPIYLGSLFWTLYYDTVYAHQDKTDDAFIGVKSSALTLGANTKSFLYNMTAGMAVSLATAGIMTSQIWPYYLTIISTTSYQANQIRKVNLDDQSDCWRVFDQQKYIGFLILAGIVASNALRHKKLKESSTNPDSDKGCDRS